MRIDCGGGEEKERWRERDSGRREGRKDKRGKMCLNYKLYGYEVGLSQERIERGIR